MRAAAIQMPEATVAASAAVQADLDLSAVSDWVLEQARDDVVRVWRQDEHARRGDRCASAAGA